MKCIGQTRGLPLLDDHGKPVRCLRWLEILVCEWASRQWVSGPAHNAFKRLREVAK